MSTPFAGLIVEKRISRGEVPARQPQERGLAFVPVFVGHALHNSSPINPRRAGKLRQEQPFQDAPFCTTYGLQRSLDPLRRHKLPVGQQ